MTVWQHITSGETRNQYDSPKPEKDWVRQKKPYSSPPPSQPDMLDPMDLLTNPINPVAMVAGIGVAGMLWN